MVLIGSVLAVGAASMAATRAIRTIAARVSTASVSSEAAGLHNRGDRPRQRRPGDDRDVEARRLHRVRLREQLVGHDHGNQAREAAERQRPRDPGHEGDRRDRPVRCIAREQDDADQARGGQHLVQDHRLAAPVARPVEPRSQHRAGDQAGQGDGRDRRAGQRGAARAVQDQQDHADREHLVGEARQRGRRVEEGIAGVAAQPSHVAVGHRLIVAATGETGSADQTRDGASSGTRHRHRDGSPRRAAGAARLDDRLPRPAARRRSE